MGLGVNDLSAPAGDAFKFDEKGKVLKGTVAFVGEPQDRESKFNRGQIDRIVKVGVDTGNGEVAYIYPKLGSQQAQSIADALRDAGLDELAEGQTLQIAWVEDKDTGKGNPMKVYAAKVEAGAPAAKANPFA